MTAQESSKRFYLKHPNYIYEKNLERSVKYKSGLLIKNKEKLLSNRQRSKKHRDSLSDCYIKSKLIACGFEKNDITPELIELKRQQITLKRLLK